MLRFLSFSTLMMLCATSAVAAEPNQSGELPKAFINGTELGWRVLVENDFTPVNGAPDTWSWKDDNVHCTGRPTGVIRTRKQYTNFELVLQWKHLEKGGNSGLFVWAPEDALKNLTPGHLPRAGIEVQILDHGYSEKYEKATGKKPVNFTTNGDIFPYGSA